MSTFVKLILIGGLLGGSVAAISAQARKNKPAPTQTKSAQETAFVLFESGQDAHANGKLEEAVKLYSQALSADETLWQAQMQLTSAYYSLNRLPEARAAINKVLTQLKEFPESPGRRRNTFDAGVFGHHAGCAPPRRNCRGAGARAQRHDQQNARQYRYLEPRRSRDDGKRHLSSGGLRVGDCPLLDIVAD